MGQLVQPLLNQLSSSVWWAGSACRIENAAKQANERPPKEGPDVRHVSVPEGLASQWNTVRNGDGEETDRTLPLNSRLFLYL